jgi:hypothetical protein
LLTWKIKWKLLAALVERFCTLGTLLLSPKRLGIKMAGRCSDLDLGTDLKE